MPLLEIDAVSKRFGPVVAVDRISMAVEAGEFFALLGPSGCGKSTLLRLIAGFEVPDRGRIVIDGVDVTARPPYARPVNMMFQSYALFPHLDVAKNIGFGLRQQGLARHQRAARVAEMLALVQMTGYARRRPSELSGGQKQRIALARALAPMPKLLLLDEPLAALDRKLREETRIELTAIQQRVGTTFLVVTHDQEEALGLASRVAVMHRGRLAQIGPPAEIYERPASRFVADFVGAANLFEGDLVPSGAAAIAVRPEKLVLSRDRPSGIAVPATVSAVAYQGGQSTVHLIAADGQRLRVHVPSAVAAALSPGLALWAGWSPEDAVALRE